MVAHLRCRLPMALSLVVAWNTSPSGQLSDATKPILHVCKTLLAAEINIHYVYPLLVGPRGLPSLAIHVDNHEMAAQTLAAHGYTLVTESDLSDTGEY